jgi:choline dehydrogenase-like flavoprotein
VFDVIRDFHSFDGGDEVACDLCIAGAGAAGIALALAFRGRPARVVVLESGGFDFEQEVQDLCRGRSVGQTYWDLDATRVRQFGGSTNHWGGMSAPLDARDFLPRSWVPHSGWPIRRTDLEPFYPAAHEILDLGPGGYDPAVLEPAGGLLPLAPDQLVPRVFRFSSPPTWLGQKYRSELEAATGVEIWLHANLVDVELGADGRAAAFVVSDLAGKRARVRARQFVLALGGIENARLLLNCDRQIAGGIGNQHDLVGRFFMDHLGVSAGRVLLIQEDWEAAYQLGHHPQAGGHAVQHALAPSDALQRSAAILNSAAAFGGVTYERPRSEGYGALHDIKEGVRERRLPDDFGANLWRVVTDLDGVARGLWERFDPTTYLVMESEQAPNPDSRVRLDREEDALGLRRVVLDWRLSEIDHRTLRVTAATIAAELGRLGVARVQLGEWLLRDELTWPDGLTASNHHLGTTRMADDPRRGVVDREGRVFGCANLYVAGSSVFPTGGFANPTVNLVALTLRLAEHLRTRLSEPLPEAIDSVAEVR